MMTSAPEVMAPPTSRANETAFLELIRTLGVLEHMQQQYFAQFGLSGSQWGVLRNLQRAEQEGCGGMRLTDLGERLLIRPPSVTGVIDRLERAGLVVREEIATDLRAKQVALTDKGRELVQRLLARHGARIETLMGGLSGAEVKELHRLLSKFRQHLQAVATHGNGTSGETL
jgi:DNA-binding MarR family transcriptional regulator